MLRKRLKCLLSIVIALAVFCSFQLAFTQEASAASGKKTVYVPVKITTVNEDGKTVYNNTYDKHGLIIKENNYGDTWAGKVTYKRNKAGLIKSIKYYDDDGKLFMTQKNTIKKGKVKVSKVYSVNTKTGKERRDSTIKYKYKKGKVVESVRTDREGSKEITKFYRNGKVKKVSHTGKDWNYVSNYNKKGYETSSKETYIDENGRKSTYSSTNKYKFDKKGNPVKEVITSVSKYDGETSKSVTKTTYKNTYTKAGKLSRVEAHTTYNYDGETSKSSYVTTYKYKKMKVAKKYKKYNLKYYI